MLSLRVELKTSRLLNGCSNQLSYESIVQFLLLYIHRLQSICKEEVTSNSC
ncbi:hypothetical protein DCAR_0622952 [Daucus carota subsp. sativus]|uniref:Uncharacterized protein n=2 Tax=Daucus carota subsp. sativus TaxID=79200 RepID=A0AAF0X963_DAUCS|nr:hypothetical protein DCAR_0622952 [Daucus carota subsp. sativus]